MNVLVRKQYKIECFVDDDINHSLLLNLPVFHSSKLENLEV